MSRPGSHGLKTYRRLLSYVRPYRIIFLLGIVATVVSSGTDALVTWLLKPLLDRGFIAKDIHFIHELPFIVIGIFLVRGASGFGSNCAIAWVGRHVVSDIRYAIFTHLTLLPTRFYDHSASGQLLATLTYTVDQVANATTNALILLIQESCFISGLLIVMCVISWKLTLLSIVTLPVIAYVARRASLRMRRISHGVQDTMGALTQIAEETIEGHQIIKLFQGHEYEKAKFKKATLLNCKREIKVVAVNALSTGLTQQVAACAIAITIYLATLPSSDMSAGGFASMLAAMLAILKPLKNLTTLSNTIQKGIAGAESIFELLGQPIEAQATTLPSPYFKHCSISLRHINFSYDLKDKPALHDISFEVAAGQTVALIGRSGSGKSTLINLLPHFYDTYTGDILINGINTREISLESLRRLFSVVTQNTLLFNDTIARNIAYGLDDSVSQEAIIQAATLAHAMEFIEQLPEGLSTWVGEKGVLLSGGQRQRLAIARALLKNAPILILDEATSALDTYSENAIQAGLKTLMADRTTFVVAHRLSTIRDADMILVFENGRIIERGTHDTLLDSETHYAQFISPDTASIHSS